MCWNVKLSALPVNFVQAVKPAIAATSFFTVACVAQLGHFGLDFRIRETGYFLLSNLFFSNGYNIYRYLPKFLAEYFEIMAISDAVGFASVVFASNFVLNWAAIVLAITLAELISSRAGVWLRGRLVPLAFAVAFVPIFYCALVAFLSAAVAFFGSAADLPVRIAAGVTAVLTVFGPLAYFLRGPMTGVGRSSMSYRRTVRAGLILAVVLVVGGATTRLRRSMPPPESAPNVLLISIDSLRADHLSSYGYERETSPNLDDLAAEGVRFETVVTPTSWTLPSHMSLLTGLDDLGHGVIADSRRLDASIPTLAERLREGGYATAGVVGAPYLSAKWGFSRGFEFYDDFTVGAGGSGADHREVTSPRTELAAVRWMEQWSERGRVRPFFLFVHFWDVHYDYNPPPPYDEAFETGYAGPVTGRNLETDDSIRFGMDPEAIKFLISQYDGEILYVDSSVGRLIKSLDSLGIAGDTAIIVTGDHGEEFFEHGNKGHRRTLYDEVTLAPLIMRLPGTIPVGKVIEQPVRTIDLAATVLRLARLGRESALGSSNPLYASRDLMPLIDGSGATEPPRLAFLELVNPKRYAVRSAHQKFVLEPRGLAELYDLDADPGETTNLADGDVETSAGYRQLLRAWREVNSSVKTDKVQQSAEQQKVLRGLGYIQ